MIQVEVSTMATKGSFLMTANQSKSNVMTAKETTTQISVQDFTP